MEARKRGGPEEAARDHGLPLEPSCRPGHEPAGEGRADRLVASNRALGVRPDGLSAGARWESRAAPKEVYFRALEALDDVEAGWDE